MTDHEEDKQIFDLRDVKVRLEGFEDDHVEGKTAGEDEEEKEKINGTVVMEVEEENDETKDKVTTLKRKRCFVSPNNNQGVKFLASIRRRDTGAIKKFQKCPSALYVFCDEYGVSPAEAAVTTKDTSTLDVLIEGAAMQHKLVFIRQAMLFAVRDEDSAILRHLLRKCNEAKGSLKNSSSGNLEQTENAEFSTEVTPIILAARLNRLDMIQQLEQAGESDIHPIADSMDESCAKKNCYVCKLVNMEIMKGTVQEYRHASEVLQAISSPAYIFTRSPDDPILETFKISQLADKLQQEDVAFAENYREIGRGCREFTRDLIGLCRSTEEVEVMLKYPAGLEVTNAKGSRAKFPRLQVAIHYEQKPFIAQANCQQVLDQEWNRGLPAWVCKTRFHDLRFLTYSTLLCILMPISFLIYSVPLCPGPLNKMVNRVIKTPVGKLIHDTISYLVFLVFIFICAMKRTTPDNMDLSPIEWCIGIWVLGLTVRWLKVMFYRRAQCMHHNSLMPTDRAWFIDDIFMILAFWIAFILRFLAYVKTFDEKTIFNLYSSSEVFFSIASIMSIMRVLSFFKSADYMGPLVVSLKSIMSPILRFMMLFVVILLAFIIGLSHLPQKSPYHRISDSFKNLFWNLFGYEEPLSLDNGDTGAEELLPNNGTRPTTSPQIDIIGTTLLGAYHVIAIIVLSNILIAMVTNIYNTIEANSDEEWKFARTQLRMSYFNEVGCLPPPFNLFPARKIIKAIKKIPTKGCCKSKEYNPEETWKKRCYSPAHAHTALMEKLRRRYRKMKAATGDPQLTNKMLMRLSSRHDYKLDFFSQNFDKSYPMTDTPNRNNMSNNCSNLDESDFKIKDVTDRDSVV